MYLRAVITVLNVFIQYGRVELCMVIVMPGRESRVVRTEKSYVVDVLITFGFYGKYIKQCMHAYGFV